MHYVQACRIRWIQVGEAIGLLLTGLVVGWAIGNERLEAGVRGELVEIDSGLNSPLIITHAGDGSGRLFIGGLEGTIDIVRDGKVSAKQFLNIRERVEVQGEGGMLGMAFHPNYSQNGRFFLTYTRVSRGQFQLVLAEYQTTTQDPDRASRNEKIVLVIDQPTEIHNGGDIAFDAAGHLYLSLGDGGPFLDPRNRAQSLNTLLGKILRIDINGTEPYAIPDDNPFVGVPGARGEIWAYGFRNPFRMSFDPLTERLFLGDVGAFRFEEVDIVEKGGNYGWKLLEGDSCFEPRQNCDPDGKTTPPILAYGRDEGQSVIGGVVYRGSGTSGLWGDYVFGDFISGRVWALCEPHQNQWERQELLNSQFGITSFGVDEAGEIYMGDMQGGVLYRLKTMFDAIIPQFGDGVSAAGSFQSSIIINNDSEAEVSGWVDFFTEEGEPGSITTNGIEGTRFPLTVAPRSTLRLVTSGGSQPIFKGWARQEADRPLGVTVLYSLVTSGGDVHVTSVSDAESRPLLVGRVGRNVALGSDTGLALVNPSEVDPAEVSLELIDATGQLFGEESVRLNARQQRSLFLSEIFEMPEAFEGTLRIRSLQPVAATLLLTLNSIHAASLRMR